MMDRAPKAATTRRALFGAAALALGATVPVIAVKSANPRVAADPILEAAYRRYRALHDEQAPICVPADVLRAALVERWGEVRFARDAWERDPAHPELMRLNDKIDDLTSEIVDATDLIIDTQATTLQGLLLKLQVALDVWPPSNEDAEYHEDAAVAAIRDAVRLLEGAVA